jgi:hypothetical protein
VFIGIEYTLSAKRVSVWMVAMLGFIRTLLTCSSASALRH